MLHDHFGIFCTPRFDRTCRLVMSPNVRAVEEDHTQGQILTLHLFKQNLPDTGLCSTDEELSRSPPRAKFCGDGSPLRPVLMAPENCRHGPSQIARRGFAFRTDCIDQRFPDRLRVIGKDRLHHAYREELRAFLHHSRPHIPQLATLWSVQSR